MSKLYITIGIPGSGKSTFVKRMRKKDSNIQIVSSDQIRKEITGTYRYVPSQSWEIFEEVYDRVNGFLKLGYDVVVDATNLDAESRGVQLGIARDNGAEVIGLIFDTPYDVCIDRNQKRNAYRRVPEDVMLSMKKLFDRIKGNLAGFDELRFEKGFEDSFTNVQKQNPNSNVIPFLRKNFS